MLAPDRDRVEPLAERVPEARDLHPTADYREDGEHRDRRGHRPRPLAVRRPVVVLAHERRRLAQEDDEEEAEGVEAGQQRPDQAGREQQLP